MSAAGPPQGARPPGSGAQRRSGGTSKRRGASRKRGGHIRDPRGAADGPDRRPASRARNGARAALPGRDRQRRFRAGLSRHGHRDGETRRRGARAGAASPARHHRSGRGLFGGAFSRRCDSGDRRASARAARVPLLVGGTMLYFKALQEGLSALPVADPAVRARLDARAAVEGWPALHAELARVDPVTAARLESTDAQRIQRALEVHEITGRPLSRAAGRAGGRRRAGQRRSPWRSCRATARHCTGRSPRASTRCSPPASSPRSPRLRERHALTPDLPSMRCVGYRQAWDIPRRRHRRRRRCARKASPRRGSWPSASSRGCGATPATAFEPSAAGTRGSRRGPPRRGRGSPAPDSRFAAVQ